ncbi:hypothetical protein GJA_3693 [Janthinobacterium agaricidamnosum NBRC 102515 = DSM 9628]|uniref:Uncharacterized protein n=1 Tax=Janthinobacterium agaricidamnosum NBRC 102515 = DSM 9628 TaxID=1349767 RepID=W0VAC2_9BURK|nr:hypothetical protein GJA_3693 [Janthinobacterium agaricidamnosum NBRC 102515 = DSM 9628]
MAFAFAPQLPTLFLSAAIKWVRAPYSLAWSCKQCRDFKRH